MNTHAPPLAYWQQACDELFTHSQASIKVLQQEISVRRGIAATIRATHAGMTADDAEATISNAIISLEHCKDELKKSATHLRSELITEEYLWSTLLEHFTNKAELPLHRAQVTTNLDAIIASTKEQDLFLTPDHIMGHARRAA